jgi:hypothetical protein
LRVYSFRNSTKKAYRLWGFSGFIEAFNAFGFGLGGRPASIKNYRDEFDPIFPNPRKGWHKRPLREHCREILELFGHLSLSDFTELLVPWSNLSPIPSELLEIKGIADVELRMCKTINYRITAIC